MAILPGHIWRNENKAAPTTYTDEAEENTTLFEKYYTKIKNLLLIALNEQESEHTHNLANIANFNLETALNAIPEFSGNYRELNSFLTIVELINDGLAIEKNLFYNLYFFKICVQR